MKRHNLTEILYLFYASYGDISPKLAALSGELFQRFSDEKQADDISRMAAIFLLTHLEFELRDRGMEDLRTDVMLSIDDLMNQLEI